MIEARPLGRILITGAAGFVGARLTQRLRDRGERPVATDLEAGSANPAVEPLDVTDASAVDRAIAGTRADAIFHCGAVSGPMVMPDRPDEIWRINTTGTVNLLEAARRAKVGRFVFCSSVDVYGSRGGGMLAETAPCNPDTVYGASKAAAEQALLGYARQHGLDAVALRLGWVYGPGRRTASLIPRLLGDALAGHETVVEMRSDALAHYQHLDDAVSALLAAATAKALSRCIYNATAGVGVPMKTVAAAIRTVVPGARIRFTGKEAASAAPLGYDNGLAEKDFGYRPVVSLEDGLSRFAAVLQGAL